MNKFGNTLRSLRQAGNDPDRLNRRLTQERLGMLIGEELGDLGFSGAAVSDWERGKSKISAADRNVLLALIQVLHKGGSLHTAVEANELLESGNYRALDEPEIQRIFGNNLDELSSERPRSDEESTGGLFLLAAMFPISKEEIDALLATAQDGPSPAWPRVLAAIMRKAFDQFSFSLRTVLWICVFLLAWWLIAPSLRLPYSNRDLALGVIGMYMAGSILVPLLIGLLVNTKDNEFWKQQNVKPSLLRLYTYQGAGIGFNLGYFFVFPIVLIRYYLRFDSSTLLEITAIGLGLLLGNMAARVVPHNLLRAYDRLTIKDGGIFFSVAFVGLFWGFFFFQYYSLFLTPLWGTLVILAALTIVALLMVRQTRNL